MGPRVLLSWDRRPRSTPSGLRCVLLRISFQSSPSTCVTFFNFFYHEVELLVSCYVCISCPCCQSMMSYSAAVIYWQATLCGRCLLHQQSSPLQALVTSELELIMLLLLLLLMLMVAMIMIFMMVVVVLTSVMVMAIMAVWDTRVGTCDYWNK